jgi:uncharacterized protein YjbI with pentapeptide repeats
MNKSVLVTISISAFLVVMILAFIPWTSVIEKTTIVSSAMGSVNGANPWRADAERTMDGIMASVLRSVGGTKPTHSDIDRVLAGQINCPRCDLHQAYFTEVSFRNADLTGANLVNSTLTRADLTGTKLDFASIKGADLSHARGLTQAQLNTACSDSQTKLPEGLHAVRCS